MILPKFDQPDRYAGLYIFDFGDWTAAGYTAEEIAVLLESEQYSDGQVYKIHRVSPDGSMELRGISRNRFRMESGIFFYRNELNLAHNDYAALQRSAEKTPPPARTLLQLADRGGDANPRFVTALIYPAEYEDEISRWLIDLDFEGGDFVEGGISCVTNYHQEDKTILERTQLWSRRTLNSRSADEIFATVRRAVQR